MYPSATIIFNHHLTYNVNMTSHLLTSLITQLSTCPSPFSSPQTNNNVQTNQSKNLLLTLHCLFPNDLLLALDIIDRRLIRRCHNRHDENGIENEEDISINEVFFVASTSTNQPTTQEKTYEVRLNAWNCSCPAFAMRAFQQSFPHSVDHELENQSNEENGEAWFGGTLIQQKESVPVCKHLLACVLAAKCATLFGRGIGEDRVVEKEELAGWCAGFAA
jgi:hypothetical protein